VTGLSGRHPSTTGILRYFTYGHLRPELQVISKTFADQAHRMAGMLEDGPELTACLRKLLEAKDCAIRCAVNREPDAD